MQRHGHLALDNAVYWFVPDPDARQIRVQAVFFGAQDHQRYMLVRLLQKGAKRPPSPCTPMRNCLTRMKPR